MRLYLGYWFLLNALTLVHLISCQQDVGQEDFGTCSSHELSHSILVECKGFSCSDGSTSDLWPANRQEIIHVQSTRAGDRFLQKTLANLDLIETEHERLLNINTTIYVSTKVDPSRHQKILGFGATLDTERLSSSSSDEVSYRETLSPILSDLFGTTNSSAQLDILRLTPKPQHDLAKVLRTFDYLIGSIRPNEDFAKLPIKLVLDLSLFDGRALESSGESMIVDIASAIPGFKSSNLEVWAIAVNLADKTTIESLSKLCPIIPESVAVLGYSSVSPLRGAPEKQCLKGYLLKWMPSIPYNILESMRQQNIFMTIPSDKPKTKDYGDWQNAHQYAVELLNHFKFGSMATVDELSSIEVLEDAKGQDSSIYSLHGSHMLHFRGPMFYAMGHFSRHISPNSRPLDVKVFTQPNMFAAHYSAYLTPKGDHVIAIVLNDNEHMLPFRLAVDGRIMGHSFLQPKSFNTFVLKL